MRNTVQVMKFNPTQLWSQFDPFEDFFSRTRLSPFARSSEPQARGLTGYNVEETEAAFVLSVDLPGVRREDLKLDVADDTITVSGERSRSWASANGQASEKSKEKFAQSFSLATEIDEENIEAHLEHGVLTVWLPKLAQKKARTIEVQSSKGGLFSKLLGGEKKTPASGSGVGA